MIRDEKYLWTYHARMKMRHYRISESRVKRIVRHPARVEEGIVPDAIAVMQRAESKQYSEIWALYVLARARGKKRIKIITAWRYPGRSPARDPIPADVLREVRSII